MSRSHPITPRFGPLFVLVALLAAILLTTGRPAWTDDRDLLSFNSGKPYLFILLDSSASMNLKVGPGDVWLPGGADNPDSRLNASKSALFEVFKAVDDVHFGFATFNQDESRARAKHWLYYSELDPQTIEPTWPLAYPAPDADGLTDFVDTNTIDTDGDGIPDAKDGFPDTVVSDVEGDALTFGSFLALPPAVDGVAGSCNVPLALGTVGSAAREKINTFAKLDETGDQVTRLWIRDAGVTWLLQIGSDGSVPLGQDNLPVTFRLSRVNVCPSDLEPEVEVKLTLRLDTGNGIVPLDSRLAEYLYVDGVTVDSSAANASEAEAGFWEWQDALTAATCGSTSPFSGKGWEGNYDSGVVTGDSAFDTNVTDVDPFCADPSDIPASCTEVRPVAETIVSSFGRPLDRGDVLPFDWQTTNKTAFLQRLAPNWPTSAPDFRVSPYFEDAADADGVVPLENDARRPIVAQGETPLGKAILDFRCWYLGLNGQNGNKCNAAAFSDAGWSEVACTFDSEYGCRRPFLIVISDGIDTCAGENPGADTAAMNSRSGVRTWSLNLGEPDNCKSSGKQNALFKIANNGKGECVNVSDRQELLDTLAGILGQIREEASAFASAAVPTLQAIADQTVIVTSFVPLNNKSVWDGHIDAFLKPLPLTDEDRPDKNDPNFLWDAGAVIRDTQVDAADPLGGGPNQRRVYYNRVDSSTKRIDPAARRLLDPTSGPPEDVRYDLWRAFGLIPQSTADNSLLPAQETALESQANAIIAETLGLKSAVLVETGETIEYILGDIFHSDPRVVGTPNNAKYFALDLGADQDEDCVVDDSDPSANRGYRCFLLRHLRRRKVLLAGSNDGMLHAVNAGIFDTGTDEFDTGSGNELFAYMARLVMPTVKELTENSTHKFAVDGAITAADVFIDPLNGGDEGPPSADQRLWRTVAVGGLREGGSVEEHDGNTNAGPRNGYYALDITQPDTLTQNADGEFIPGGGVQYLPSCLDGGSDCGPLPYPAALWEFADTTADSLLTGLPPAQPVQMDEDPIGSPGRGSPDLGDTWSVVNIGRIRLCEGSECNPENEPNDLVDKHVAVFGGGMDLESRPPADAALARRGNWIYIVDIETGKVLYKRSVVGAVPARLATVDTDQDGYFDRIYAPTLAGLLYRVDLTRDASGNYPALTNTAVTDINNVARSVDRILVDSGGDPTWVPQPIFDANFDGGDPISTRRQFFQQPAVLFVADLGLYAVAIGTGNREDLWSVELREGRFYVFVDDTDQLNPALLPLNEAAFQRILVNDGPINSNLLTGRDPGQKGWYLVLEFDEKVITDAFALSGVTVFSSFQPDVALTDEDGDPIEGGGTCGDNKYESDVDNLCSKTGVSRIFVLNTTNADPFLTDPTTGNAARLFEISSFVTNPYTEVGTNQNPDDGDGDGDGGGKTADDLTEAEIAVMNTLKGLFPDECTFANYRIDIKTVSADTRVQRIAAVPVCIIDKNFREF